MAQLNALDITLRATFDEWIRTRWSDLQFADARTALLVFVVLLAASVLSSSYAGCSAAGRDGRTWHCRRCCR